MASMKSRPIIRQLPVYVTEGADGWNLAVFKLEQRGEVIGYRTFVMYMGVFRAVDGRLLGYQGECRYDTEVEAMADRLPMLERAKRFISEQSGVPVAI